MLMSGSFKGVECSTCNPGIAQLRGCKKPTAHPQWVDIDGTEYYRCPRSLKISGLLTLSRLYNLYLKGILPVEGGLLDQSATCMDALSILESAMNDIEIERAKSRNKK